MCIENYLIDKSDMKIPSLGNRPDRKKKRSPMRTALTVSVLAHLAILSVIGLMNKDSKQDAEKSLSPKKVSEQVEPFVHNLDSALAKLDEYRGNWPTDERKLELAGWGDNLKQFAFRVSPLEELIELGAGLFYFEVGYQDISSSRIGDSGAVKLARNDKAPVKKETSENRFEVFLMDESKIPKTQDTRRARAGLKPEDRPLLGMDDYDMKREVLRFVNMRDDQKVQLFATEYLEKYDLDAGDLPALTRKIREWVLCEPYMYYTVQNVPYIEIERSVSFLEAMYHWKLIEKHIMPVVNAHPESKVAAEFFGDFAFSYVREKRALRQLRKTYAIAEKVLDGELTGSNYELRKPKALVVKEVYESVERAVERNGFGSLDEVFELYDERSEMFFNRLIQRGGKCRNDALYWMAQSYIMDKDFTRFAETWEMIDEASGFPSSYEEKAYAEITQMKSRGVVDLLAYEIRYNSHSPHTEDPYLVKAIKRNTINGLWNRRSQDILRRREQGVKLKFDWYAK